MSTKTDTTTTEAGQTLFMRSPELIGLLGISKTTYHRLAAQGLILDPVRLTRKPQWGREEVMAWVRAGCPSAKEWRRMQGRG